MLQQPETIDRYQVLDLIGQGSAGSVYRVLEPDHGDRFAVKLLSKTVSDIPDMQRRFVREVSILQRLQHEHVVRQIDCGLHDGQIFVVMELVDRGTLGQLLVNTPCLHWRDAVRYSQQICSALSYIHEQGVIHRDIKPANLFLSHKDLSLIHI